MKLGSALTDFLKSKVFSPDCKLLRLFADACAGQNKNCYVMYALMIWLLNYAHPTLKNIMVTFPLRGNSFLPADRVFGRLEIKLKNFEIIINPEEYNKVYNEVGTVKQ